MASIQQMLQASGGSFPGSETIALQAVANGKHEFWLDLALLLSVQGKFTGARQAQSKYLEFFPNCPRVHFGMAPFALHDGELQAGLRLLERGREISCWGRNSFPETMGQVWNGSQNISGKTVLLYGEGGLGDEILNLRAASWAHERGAKCVVACSKELMPLAATSAASAVVDIERADSVYCDYWIPAMSAPRLFERSWESLYPGQYIFNKNEKIKRAWSGIIPRVPGKINVGIRWRGNPRFEHEQLRYFDPKFLFEATSIPDVTLWSLQKEEGIDLPEGIADLEPFLTSWEHTAAAMSQLDLVITSCTSIAHVAGAMGIPTWVIVPVMPYYCWAQPGQNTAWYPSVRVYRQEKFDDWERPFSEIKRDLTNLIKGEQA